LKSRLALLVSIMLVIPSLGIIWYGCTKGPSENIIYTTNEPTVTIITPVDGSTIAVPAGDRGEVTVSVNVTNFDLVNKIGAANVRGQGHIIYYFNVNGGDVPVEQGVPATVGPGETAETTSTSYTWPNVEPDAPYIFSVQLVNNDQTPLDPPVVATVSIETASK
jgi:hypothetical protein